MISALLIYDITAHLNLLAYDMTIILGASGVFQCCTELALLCLGFLLL